MLRKLRLGLAYQNDVVLTDSRLAQGGVPRERVRCRVIRQAERVQLLLGFRLCEVIDVCVAPRPQLTLDVDAGRYMLILHNLVDWGLHCVWPNRCIEVESVEVAPDVEITVVVEGARVAAAAD